MRAVSVGAATRTAPITAVVCVASLAGCSDVGTAPGLRRLEIHLTPAASALMVNDTARARLYGFDQSGAPYPAGPVTWRSNEPSIVT